MDFTNVVDTNPLVIDHVILHVILRMCNSLYAVTVIADSSQIVSIVSQELMVLGCSQLVEGLIT